jgi:hypothetical protein
VLDEVPQNEDRRLEASGDLQQKKDWIRPLLLIAVPLYLYLNLFTFASVPFLLGGDQTFFWIFALRMLHGERVYRDFFQFTPPGTDLVYLALLRLFGPHVWIVNLTVLLLGVALCWICFRLAQRLMERDMALLSSLLFLVYIYADSLDATHHWFSLLAALCAVYVVIPARTPPRIAVAGVLLGVASFFTQTAGAAAVLALIVSLAWDAVSGNKSWRIILKQQLLLCIVFGLTWSALNGYFLVHVGWKQLWYFQVAYPQRYIVVRHEFLFPNMQVPLTRRVLLERAQQLPLYALLLGIYPSVLWSCWRRRRESASQEKMPLILLAMLGLCLLLTTITRVNWNRLYSISMPAIVLLLWAVARLDAQRIYIKTAIGIVIACGAANQIRSRQFSPYTITTFPAGKAAISTQWSEKLSWLVQHTQPWDLFFQAQQSSLYLPLKLRSPVFVDSLSTSEDLPPEYVALTIQQLEHQPVKYILWSQKMLDGGQAFRFGPDHLDPFRAFLNASYRRVQVFSDGDEIWERR